MIFRAGFFRGIRRCLGRLVVSLLVALVLSCLGVFDASATGQAAEKYSQGKEAEGEFSWEMPGRVSIYDLQFGAAIAKNNQWEFLGNTRSFNAGSFKDHLTLMVRFSYKGSKPDTEIKFIVRLPGSRQYEETVSLPQRQGSYTYKFTIHNPENFVGSGSVYLYYGFSMVDVLNFTIMPGT